MKIPFEDISITLKSLRFTNTQNDLILFLHGFSGSSKDWEGVSNSIDIKFNLAALDLIGHGESDSPAELFYYDTARILGMIKSAIRFFQKDKIILCGYSMGGRAALSFAVQNPKMVKGLILESSTAGIINLNERKLRIQKDKELAQFILTHSIAEFVDYWMNLELFSSQKNLDKNILDEIRKLKRQNNPTGLANSLVGFGTGAMPPLFNELGNLEIKTLLLTGELDSKFTFINQKMKKQLPSAQHFIIDGAGHNVHLENSKNFCETLNSFLFQL